MLKKKFIITIDTEGDNLWNSPSDITVKNAIHLPLFHELCESFNFKPTYVVNYEMAKSKEFISFGREVIKNKSGEIGMHLHAWNSPPIYSLTHNDNETQPFLIEYPSNIMEQKIDYLTSLLEDTFSIKITSHRAGRWAFNETYASLLQKRDYLVDCSIIPYVSLHNNKKLYNHTKIPDYRFFPTEAYYLDPNNIKKKAKSGLLEVPMTIRILNNYINRLRPYMPNKLVNNRIISRFSPPIVWLRPNGKNTKHMLNIVNECVSKDTDYIQFMLHSSELMAGGSPTFKTQRHIDNLYGQLKQIFSCISKNFEGCTLTEFFHFFQKTH